MINRFLLNLFRCGTHSSGEGYAIEQDLTKAYPDCCAKLVKVEKKAKRVHHIDASAVKINKFKGRDQAAELKPKKVETTSTSAPVPAKPKETNDKETSKSE